MLQSMREGTHSHIIKFILFGLILMAVCGLALMDVNGFFRRGGFHSTTVAKIGSYSVSAQAFDHDVRRVLMRQNLDAKTAYQYGFIDQFLNSEIRDRLIQQAALSLGLMVSDRGVAGQIEKLVQPMIKDGSTPQQALDRILTGQGMNERDLVEAIREEMTGNLLRTALQSGSSVIPPQSVRLQYQFDNEERALRVFVLKNDAVKTVKDPTDKELAAYYETAKEKYSIPEKRDFTVALLTQDKLKQTIDIAEQDIRKDYDDNIDEYSEPEKRILEQAILKDQADAKKVVDKIADGSTLKDAVKAATGKTDAYTGEDSFDKKSLAEQVADKAFAAKANDVIGPIETPLGWHVIVVKKVTPAHTRPYEEAKDRIRQNILRDKLEDAMYEMSNEIDDKLAGGASLDEVAADMKLDTIRFQGIQATGLDKDGKDALKDRLQADRANILKQAFSLDEGENSPVMELSDGRYAAVHMDSIKDKGYKPLDEIKGELKTSWIAEQKKAANAALARQALKDLNDGGKKLEDVAAALGSAVQDIKPFKRNADPPAPLTKTSAQIFFEIGEKEFAKADSGDGQIVGQVTSIALPDPAKADKKDIAKYADDLRSSNQGELGQLYMDDLLKKYGVSINRQMLESMYGQSADGQ